MRKFKTNVASIKKGMMLTLGLALLAGVVQAQNIGTAIDAATSEVTGMKDNLGNLVLALGGVVGLVGGIRVFVKWNNGDQDIQKHLIGWVAACIFLVISGLIVTAFFG